MGKPNPFREKLLSLQISPQVRQPEARRNYFDAESVHSIFGEDAQEQMLDDTGGLGYAKTGPDGTLYHRDRKTGDIEPVDPDEYTGGADE